MTITFAADSPARAALLSEITAKAVVHGEVVLSSGLTSSWYIDLRRIGLDGSAAPLAGRAMLELVRDLEFDAVGGLTLGADPVATAMMHTAAADPDLVGGRKINAFVVRKTTKTHGMQQRIEGPSIAGRRVLVVEDASTTGGSPMTAVEAAREAGAEVVAVAVIVERGAEPVITEAGLPYLAVFSVADLGLE
jgi:orotate phosphoribosyltransferase